MLIHLMLHLLYCLESLISDISLWQTDDIDIRNPLCTPTPPPPHPTVLYIYSLYVIKQSVLDYPDRIIYYGRKKYPDPPIINTDIIHMSRRNF